MVEVTGLRKRAAPDTVGGMQMLHVNASAMLRRIAFNADNSVTRPHIKRYYDDWLMVHGDESEKGDATTDALGSTALVERETQALQGSPTNCAKCDTKTAK